jgi:pimeloyl-ACP methyl ester carboxylesterase
MMPTFSFHGLHIAYRCWGTGEPVVLLHSGGSSSSQWEKVAVALSPAYRLIAPDLIGFGESDRFPQRGGLTHDLQADMTAAVIGALGEAPVHLVGHSYGGGTAMRLIARHLPLVRSLVMIEPVLPALLREANDPLYEIAIEVGTAFVRCVDGNVPEKGWQIFIDSRNGDGTWSRMSDRSRSRFLAQSEQTRDGFISNWNNPTTLAECRKLNIPVTIVCSELARPEDRRLTEILHEAIPASRYEGIPEAGHMAPLTHPAAVVELVSKHIARANCRW